MEYVVVGVFVAAALGYAVYRIGRSFQGRDNCGCGGSCPGVADAESGGSCPGAPDPGDPACAACPGAAPAGEGREAERSHCEDRDDH